ncbi:DUF4829 domain-containing protein [Clostridium cylindrosporum]|uniref:DUF4829 domain-containing protein n=1 Tax=Clostridium cylindrosporum DSM 605 TaxID=1121307 RepID=A0A0J8DG49_CLOCY|nr:DUF4829 domain-containing protein [Clostridium cylindrosporum]KMT23143.1 hypothetical protein CLCY_6c00240 [Clostridium cylindrosporum DSM 605]
MSLKAKVCLSIIFGMLFLVGCSIKEENSLGSTNKVKNSQSNKVDVNSTNKDSNEQSLKIIKEYFRAMENHDVPNMRNLFFNKLSNLPENFNVDYVKSITINNIMETDYNDDKIKVYVDYIKSEYGVDEHSIKIFKISFNININKGYSEEFGGENSQKFALIRDLKTGKWLICEVFR